MNTHNCRVSASSKVRVRRAFGRAARRWKPEVTRIIAAPAKNSGKRYAALIGEATVGLSMLPIVSWTRIGFGTGP